MLSDTRQVPTYPQLWIPDALDARRASLCNRRDVSLPSKVLKVQVILHPVWRENLHSNSDAIRPLRDDWVINREQQHALHAPWRVLPDERRGMHQINVVLQLRDRAGVSHDLCLYYLNLARRDSDHIRVAVEHSKHRFDVGRDIGRVRRQRSRSKPELVDRRHVPGLHHRPFVQQPRRGLRAPPRPVRNAARCERRRAHRKEKMGVARPAEQQAAGIAVFDPGRPFDILPMTTVDISRAPP